VPSILNPAELSVAQWNFLVSVLQCEAGLPGAVAPAGVSPGNRLNGIKYVGRGYSLWTKQLPSIGVQRRSIKLSPGPSQRRWVTTIFDIVIGTQSTDASATTRNGSQQEANLEDAMAQLDPLVSDTSGNGLTNVLIDPQYRTMGQSTVNSITQNNAQNSEIDEINFEWDASGGELETGREIYAYAIFTFVAKAYIAIF